MLYVVGDHQEPQPHRPDDQLHDPETEKVVVSPKSVLRPVPVSVPPVPVPVPEGFPGAQFSWAGPSSL